MKAQLQFITASRVSVTSETKREAEAPQTGPQASLEIHVQLQLGIERSLERRQELSSQK